MNWRAWSLTIVAAITMDSAAVLAQDAVATPIPLAIPVLTHTAQTYPLQSTGSATQLALYLVLLIALLGAGFYVMRNGFAFLQPKPKGPRKLEVSETRMLGNRQFLIVAEYESRKMLIGVCPGRIEYLCTLSGAEPEFSQLALEEEK